MLNFLVFGNSVYPVRPYSRLRRYLACLISGWLLALPILSVVSAAPTVTTTIPVPTTPVGVAVNSLTNRAYVALNGNNSVLVIDGSSNGAAATVAVGNGPGDIAVDPVNNRIYVANYGGGTGNSVSVIDGNTNAIVATLPSGTGPLGIGVNPNTNRIYTANFINGQGNTVSVLDGNSGKLLATINVGAAPEGIGVNPNTNRVYVTNDFDRTVSVIDGGSNGVIATVGVGNSPAWPGINPVTNRVYVPNFKDNTVSVIDGANNNVIATVPVGVNPQGVTVNFTTNQIYVSSRGGNTISVIDGNSNTVINTVTVGTGPSLLGVNTRTGRVYVGNQVSNTISVVSDRFATNQFQQLWEYSDKLVDEVPGAGRGYTWGPNSFGVFQEDYQEAPGGKRLVQYFDKSRMELASSGVTNGLLTKELVTGQRQDGDAKFTQLAPSTVQVAGDDNSGGGNAVCPSYASFRGVVTFNPGENAAPNRVGQVVNQAINNAGQLTTLASPPAPVQLGAYDSTLQHNIPQVFVDFENLSGRVWSGSSYLNGRVYTDNPTANVFGLPISEPYWTRAVVAGQEKDVLVQLFERRVLTYTPTNPEGFKVEMGNIGQHYYRWRYGK